MDDLRELAPEAPEEEAGLDAEPEEPAEGTAEEGAEESAGTPERPEWLDPRYATPEDQAKAYHEAQKRMHEATEQAAALKRELEQVRQSAPSGPDQDQVLRDLLQTDPDLQDLAEELQEAQQFAESLREAGYDDGDLETQRAQLELRRAQRRFERSFQAALKNRATRHLDPILSETVGRLAAAPEMEPLRTPLQQEMRREIEALQQSGNFQVEFLPQLPRLQETLYYAALGRLQASAGQALSQQTHAEEPAHDTPPRLESGRGAPSRVDPQIAAKAKRANMSVSDYLTYASDRFRFRTT